MSEHKGLRFNQGKKRYDLVHPWAHEQMVNVLTKGAEKYAERNWERGMLWSNVISSLKRHLAAIEKGEDYDPETGELHAAHIACNAHFLTAYYKIYPQGDNRPHGYLKNVKIGLDIDEVLAKWCDGYKKRYNLPENHLFNCWYLDYDIVNQCKNDLREEFYLGLEPKISPLEIPFTPHCYITSRNIPTEVTQKWLHMHGFPCVPVYTVGLEDSKVEVVKKSGVDIFVDDVYKNFLDLNAAGICCFLFDAPHNQRYDVGYKRIQKLSDLL